MRKPLAIGTGAACLAIAAIALVGLAVTGARKPEAPAPPVAAEAPADAQETASAEPLQPAAVAVEIRPEKILDWHP